MSADDENCKDMSEVNEVEKDVRCDSQVTGTGDSQPVPTVCTDTSATALERVEDKSTVRGITPCQTGENQSEDKTTEQQQLIPNTAETSGPEYNNAAPVSPPNTNQEDTDDYRISQQNDTTQVQPMRHFSDKDDSDFIEDQKALKTVETVGSVGANNLQINNGVEYDKCSNQALNGTFDVAVDSSTESGLTECQTVETQTEQTATDVSTPLISDSSQDETPPDSIKQPRNEAKTEASETSSGPDISMRDYCSHPAEISATEDTAKHALHSQKDDTTAPAQSSILSDNCKLL